MLCDEELNYCEKNAQTCLNGGRCTSLTREDGYFMCECPSGFRGRQCEIVPPSMMTTSAPNLTQIVTKAPMVVQAVKATSETPVLGDDLLHKNDVSTEDINNEAK